MSKNTSTDIWIAGAFAAFSVDLLVYPLDTLKTRIQSPDYRKLFVDAGTHSVNRTTLFRGLYQGLGSVILATLPSSGAFFTTYEAVKSLGTRHDFNGLIPAPVIHSLASGTAELVSCAILTPAEVIKQNAQMVSRATTLSPSATAQAFNKFKKNPLGLWRGYGVLVGRNLPFTALQFPIFEKFKEMFKTWRARQMGPRTPQEVSLLEHTGITAIAAGSAGSIAAVVTTPIDVVKTRVMLAAATSFADQDNRGSGKQVAQAFTEGKIVDAFGKLSKRNDPLHASQGSWAIGKEILRTHGWIGLMRGGALRAVWTMLGSGLYLGIYEGSRLYLERGRTGGDGV